MSAGSNGLTPQNSMEFLAPKFRDAVERALALCDAKQLNAYVFETYRTNELQQSYYAKGRTVIPPTKPVTNAPDNLRSWHGYGLAVDVIHRDKKWDAGTAWFEEVAAIFKSVAEPADSAILLLKWGGDWKARDLPHFQWGRCKPSPSDEARRIIMEDGLEGVWRAVSAI
jgi:hypothetical protein